MFKQTSTKKQANHVADFVVNKKVMSCIIKKKNYNNIELKWIISKNKTKSGCVKFLPLTEFGLQKGLQIYLVPNGYFRLFIV